MRQNDIAQLNESSMAAVGFDRSMIAAFRNIARAVGMVEGATTLPQVVAAQGQTQESIDAIEPQLLALIASHTDSLRAQLAQVERAPDAGHGDSALRRRVEELEMQVAALNPAPVAPACLPLAATSSFVAYQAAAQAVVPGDNLLAFGTRAKDDLGEYNHVTSTFRAMAAGVYVFAAGVHGGATAATERALDLWLNGSPKVRMQDTNNGTCDVTIAGTSGPVYLDAGDSVQLHYYTGMADTTNPTPWITYFSGYRIK